MGSLVRRLDQLVSSRLAGFGRIGTAYLVAVLAVGAFVENVYAFLMVVVWILLSHTPLAEIGIKRPHNLIAVLLGSAIAGVMLKLFMMAVIMPLYGAPSHNPLLSGLEGNSHALWTWSLRVIVFGGLVEEVIYRGYLINRLTAAWGRGVVPTIGIIAATALVFGVPHYMEQGIAGAISATIGGVVLAIIYLANGRQLISVIVIHAANDVCAVWLTFAGLNDRIAHLIWK